MTITDLARKQIIIFRFKRNNFSLHFFFFFGILTAFGIISNKLKTKKFRKTKIYKTMK